MIAALVAALLALGVWQLERMWQKQAWLASISAQAGDAPLTQLPEMLENALYHPVQLTGQWVPAATLLVGPRNHEHRVGYLAYSLFRTREGQGILVNRGWRSGMERQDLSPLPALPAGTHTLSGVLAPIKTPRWFVPANNPVRHEWLWLEVPAIAAHLRQPLLAYTVEGYHEPRSPARVMPFTPSGLQPADHLGYALTWFGCAVGLLAVCWMYQRQKAV